LAQFKPLDAERVALLEALGRVLATDIAADANIPPFDNSAMDGYAVVASDTARPPVSLRVIGDAAAGQMTERAVTSGAAIRIMTGAPMPPGADAVVRFEQTSEGLGAQGHGTKDRAQAQRGAVVQVFAAVQPGDSVRRAGEDVACGQAVLAAGVVIRPQEIGLLAALGHASVAVHRRPRTVILATGDELVSIHEPVTPGKIRNVNEYTMAAMVRRYGGEPICLGIARDQLEHLKAKVNEGLAHNPDLMLTSAGVSVGDYDMVKEVLAEEGRMEFWSVAIKPGKPMAFGQARGVPLIGLPGNPVAAMVSFEQFVRPALLKMAGRRELRKPTIKAVAQEEILNSGRRSYVRAIVERRGRDYTVRPAGEQGSAVLVSMVKANSLLIVPEGVQRIEAGQLVDVQMLDWNEEHF
ncbi:MAG: molybdopterin molybdotransferase MoeA, partial [Chloroflexi bacterium]|nr:molybdopterin molybdotransferase MoeA [Chloroflexota bacterium]